jgi:glyoxylase-like metal-dependent hydrolase (beta-lactamase superfamily II)
MIFQQLFESDSSTYTYLLACSASREAILLDPVLETVERDLELLQAMNLKLIATVETHVHADHLTGAWKLKQLSGCKIAYPAMDQPACADIGLQEGTPFRFGKLELHPLFVPGHTSHHHAYLMAATSPKMLFTGDSLLIDGCGRTDFQHGGVVRTAYDRSIEEDADLDPNLHVRFQSNATGHVGGGIEWHATDRFTVRFDARSVLWRVHVPSGFQTSARVIDDREWVPTGHLGIGLGFRL